MKKALLVTSLLVITALTFAPTARAFSINFGNLSRLGFHQEERDNHNGGDTEKCKEDSHGAEVEEEHESDQAELHENEHEDDNEDCVTGSPTVTPTGIPVVEPTSTPISTETATPTSTPTGTPTPSASPLLTVGINANSSALEAIGSLLRQILEFLQSLGSREH